MFEKKARLLLDQLWVDHNVLLRRYPPANIIAILDALPANVQYHYVPEEIEKIWNSLLENEGSIAFDIVLRAVMLDLIVNFNKRAVGICYTNEIMQRFKVTYSRILKSIEDPKCNAYSYVNDIMMKDLALCRQYLFPSGALVVESRSAFPRSLIFSNGLGQAIQLVFLLLKVGGNKPFYQTHIHLSEMEDFSPDGRDRGFMRIAEMLEANPEIKGMYGGSWFYDPALEKISPHLVYLRKRPQDNGARIFYVGVDVDSGALSKSKTRQRLYDEGKYIPKSYALIWSRKSMIDWAKSQKHGLSQLP